MADREQAGCTHKKWTDDGVVMRCDSCDLTAISMSFMNADMMMEHFNEMLRRPTPPHLGYFDTTDILKETP